MYNVTNDGVDFAKADDHLACKKEPVVDTVGAGDAFCGALSAHLLMGKYILLNT